MARMIEGPAPPGAKVGNYWPAKRCLRCSVVDHRQLRVFCCWRCGGHEHRVVSVRYWWPKPRSMLHELWQQMTGDWHAKGFEVLERSEQ